MAQHCVSCRVCETLIVSCGVGETCIACGWAPGEYPTTSEELEQVMRVVRLRAGGKRFPVELVAEVRRFMCGERPRPTPYEIRFVTSKQTFEEWETLVDGGLYGSTEHAAEELFRGAVRRELQK